MSFKSDNISHLVHHFNRHVKTHIRNQTTKEKDPSLFYYCERCGKGFTTPEYVSKHIKTVHEGIKIPGAPFNR